VLRPCEAPLEKSADPTMKRGSETILVVEDELTLRELVQHILGRFGYHVLEASCGPEAMEIWKERKSDIDLLFTDLVMPNGMNGIELAAQLRRPSAPQK